MIPGGYLCLKSLPLSFLETEMKVTFYLFFFFCSQERKILFHYNCVCISVFVTIFMSDLAPHFYQIGEKKTCK